MREWVTEFLAGLEDAYLKTPVIMTGAYNRERSLKKEYDGRQLLELLQNADDAAENAETPEILISLEDRRLIVANNGDPFQRQGILSLMFSDNSPKTMAIKKIGYKGLGFRAVLNWSDAIWIKSGGFSIEFSRKNAVAFFRELLRKNPRLGKEIQEQFSEKYKYEEVCPIATLSVPVWKETWDIDTSLYDTYVVINFDSEKIRKDIQEKINGLRMEVALFLNNLGKVVIKSLERNETIEKFPSDNKEFKEIRITNDEGDIIARKKWRIFHKTDELPKELRNDERAEQYEYDLRIAVSENMDDNVDRLFSYFKTEVKFPFPAIVHGTFELDDSRNHLVKSPTNEFLFKELANLMIDSAIELTQAEGNVNWNAMKLLAKRGEFDDKIEEMGFYEHMMDAMKPKKLVPVISNKYMSVDEGPVFYNVPFANILKRASDIFPKMAIYTTDKEVKELVEALNVGTYKKDRFIELINKVSERLSTQERADLILLIAGNYPSYFQAVNFREMPSLFTDVQGRVVSSRIQALLPPERARFKLPDNIKITFISDNLVNVLRTKAGVRRGRDLATKLNCFNVDEYRFDTVIRRIVAETNRLIRDNDAKAADYTKSMLSALFQIYHDDPEAAKQFPQNVNVQVFSRSGIVRSSRELYFGKEYSTGKIMESLYARIDDTFFVGGREKLGLGDKDEKDATAFLKWMGVAEYPRIAQKKLQHADFGGYDDCVFRNLTYPYKTNQGDTYLSYEELKNRIYSYSTEIEICYIEEMENILNEAAFEDVLTWFHCDDRIQRILREGKESSVSGDSNIKIIEPRQWNKRNIYSKHLTSYILWKLKTSEWIKTRSGNKVRPRVCCLSRTVIDMSPLIEVPAYDMRHGTFKENNVRQEDVEYILEKVGSARDFGKLSDETIYAVLKNLESADTEGKKARTVYRQIIQSKPTEWARDVRNIKARNEFVDEGKLLARHDGKIGYLPVKDVYYVDNITFCRQIMNRFPIAQIDRRSGKEQVRDIFGATPLEDIRFRLAGTHEIHPLNSAFSTALESFRPYVFVFRLDKPKWRTELNQLRRLKIVLCTKVPAKYEFGDTIENLILHPYEHIYISEENTAYLLLQEGKHKDIDDLKNDMAFCGAFAEILTGILKVEENRKDYRDLFPKEKRLRDMIIRDDLDDPELEKLKKSRELFTGLSDLELEFWESILLTKGKANVLEEDDKNSQLVELIAKELDLRGDFVRELYEGIYYEDYNSSANLPHFKRLFEALGISVQDFNRHSTTHVDLIDHLREEFENEKFRLRRRFKSFVFAFLKDKNLEDKERFLKIIEAFDRSSIKNHYNINKELSLDLKKCFDILFKIDPFKQLGLDFDTLLRHEDSNPDGDFTKNIEAFKKRINETGGGYDQDIEAFLNALKNRSLMFFGEIDELLERFDKAYSRPPKDHGGAGGGTVRRKKKSISLNGVAVEYEEDDFEAIFKNVDEDLKSNNYEIESHVLARPEEKAGDGVGHVGGFGGGGGTAKKQNKEIGFLGEKYVYGQLVKKYSKDNVVWASQYARMVNVNPEGRDDIGYDIWYLDENGERHYVEVKASKDDELAFTISKPEVRFGEQNKFNYEIIMVLNVCNKNRKLMNLGKIFEYDEDESFHNNNKFKVDTDNFRVSFK